MPRTAHSSMIVEHTKQDGSIVRARLELRPEGTYAIDLRKFHRGRPTLKPEGSLRGTKDLKEAKELALRELRAIAGGMTGGTRAAILGPQSQLFAYLDAKVRA